MDLTSTPLLKYEEINVDSTDIYDDAWGFVSEFSDVLDFLGKVDNSPAGKMGERLIGMLAGKH